jgi:hypothetical protein
VIRDGTLAADVEQLVDEAVERCEFVKPWRNRWLAHMDLGLAKNNQRRLSVSQSEELSRSTRRRRSGSTADSRRILSRFTVGAVDADSLTGWSGYPGFVPQARHGGAGGT